FTFKTMNNLFSEKKILAVMPFSVNGKDLARNAVGFADKIQADLLLLNLGAAHVKERRPLKKRRTRSFSAKEFISQLQQENEDHPSVRDLQAVNQPPSLSEANIDLVIAPSSENAEEFENRLIDALNPFKDSGCKVLYLPEGNELKSIEKALYITDIRYCDLSSLKAMIELFR